MGFLSTEKRNLENMTVATNPNHAQMAVLTPISTVAVPGEAYQIK